MHLSADLMLQQILEVRANLRLDTPAGQLRAILHSVRAATAKILYDHHGMACGYVLWANVNKESARLLAGRGQLPTAAHEWQEGGIALILEVLLTPDALPFRHGLLRAFLRQQRALLFGRKGRVSLYVRRAGRVFKKRYAPAMPAAEAA